MTSYFACVTALILALMYFIAVVRETENVYKMLIGNPKGRRSLSMYSRRKKSSEIVCDWLHLAQEQDQ
jgi:hypothetical protein